MARYALFIGISDYLDRYISNLRLAHRDAQNLHGLFRHRLGYGDNAILLPPNAGLREFNRQFNAIGEKIQAGDSFILYFAGHGHQHGDNQYLLLPEANRHPIEMGDVIGEELLSLNNLKTKVERWPDSDCLFILDACRSPIAAELKRGDSARYQGTEVLQRMFTRDPARRAPRSGNKAEAAAQAVVLNACSENDVAYEPAEGDAGVLCRALEAEIVASLQDGRPIAINADTSARLIGHIRQHWSDCPQTPWLSPAESSFLLHAREGGVASSPVESEKPGTGGASYLDERQWRLACLKNTEVAYETYIKEAGPQAAQIDEAFARIEAIRVVVVDAQRKADDAARKSNAELVAAERAAEEMKLRGIEAERTRLAMEQRRQTEEATRAEAEAQEKREAAEAEHLRREQEKARQEAETKRRAEETTEKVRLRPGQVFRDADWAPEMVVIPPGEFWMGSPESEPDRMDTEGPQHRVKIAHSFALGKYPVTQREWQAMMGYNRCEFKGDELPVENVSWDDAQAFIGKLNLKLAGKCVGLYRLPSEAEWEYACRAGTSTPYSLGEKITSAQANFDGGDKHYGNQNYGGQSSECRAKTTPVGCFAPNGWELYDMHGNVLEWVEDEYHENYEGAPQDGRAWVSSCQPLKRVLRGGSWFCTVPYLGRSASRDEYSSGCRNFITGFRVARTL